MPISRYVSSSNSKNSINALHASPHESDTLRHRTPAPALRHHPLTNPLQLNLSHAPSARQLLGRKTYHALLQPTRSLTTAASQRSTPAGPVEGGQGRDTSLLVDEGFTMEDATHVVQYHSSRKLKINIRNVQKWIQLLRRCQVEQPAAALSRHPFIFGSLADDISSNAEAIVQWMSSRGLTQLEIVKTISKWPTVFKVTHANIEAVAAWLCTELKWSDDMVTKVLSTHPKVFSLRPDTLSSKVAWFTSVGFSDDAASRVLFIQPHLFSLSAEHHTSQLQSLVTFGLSQSEAVALIRKGPTILTKNNSGATQRAKVQFLTQVMQRSIHELTTCSTFLSYSLTERIGPRWHFFATFCPEQPQLSLTRLLQHSNEDFTELKSFASSPSLKLECDSRGLTRLEVFLECMEVWQQGEGRVWVVVEEEKHPKKGKQQPSRKTGVQVVSHEGPAVGESTVDELPIEL